MFDTIDFDLDRRSFVKAAGAAGAAAALPQTAAAAPSTETVDDALDLADDALHEVLVVFESTDQVERLGDLEFAHDRAKDFHAYEVLPIGYTLLTSEQVRSVADWNEVRRVKESEELEYYNTTRSREAMAAEAVQNDLGYDGSGGDAAPAVDVCVIDSGIDGSHPGYDGRVESNWEFVDDPLGPRTPIWVDVGAGDSDHLGHGTHCAGIVAGDGGGGTQGDYRGMAPGARLTGYSVGQTVYLPYVVGAWDHMLARADDDANDFDPQVVTNSYGVARGTRYNPDDPVNVASWEAFRRGIVPVWAQGNDGPGAGTSNRFAKAPHVLGVAAADVDKHVVDFSSRGRDLPRSATEYDREATLRNLQRFHAIRRNGQSVVDTGEFVGSLGPGVNSSPATSGVDEELNTGTHELRTYENADSVTLNLSLDPEGQWVRTTVYEGRGTDGRRVAMMGEEPLHQHRTLTFAVDGGQTYTVELEPEETVTVDYTLEYEMVEKFGGDLADVGPVTLFRPGVATHGATVVSTIDPHDALAPLGPAYGGQGTEPLYGAMSGTSMACPAAAGICALVIDAYRRNHGSVPDPIDVITTVEATAEDVEKAYTPANAGAGFVNALAAVRRAESGDLASLGEVSLADPDTPVSLNVAGSRSDDGSVFTGGQTNQVDVTVASLSHDAEVRDAVPAGWTVLTDHSDDVERVEAGDGVQHVHFGTVPAGESASFTYFVEAPTGAENTGQYDFGAAQARAPATDDAWVAFGGTDTNTVVGQDTNL